MCASFGFVCGDVGSGNVCAGTIKLNSGHYPPMPGVFLWAAFNRQQANPAELTELVLDRFDRFDREYLSGPNARLILASAKLCTIAGRTTYERVRV